MAESSNRFIVLDNPTKKYIQKQQNKKTRAKTRATNVLKKANMPWALSTTKSFTKQGNVWKLQANDLQKKQGKENKSNATEALTVDEVNILYGEYLHQVFEETLRRNKNITWHLFSRMLKGENLVQLG